MKKIKPVTPGEMLEEEFLKPLGLTKYRLAKDIGVPAQRIGDIVAGKRAITADTDLRLCRYFGLSDGWWLRGQMEYDMAITKAKMGRILAAIQPRDLSPA
jgi:addiction module HigA family antidote